MDNAIHPAGARLAGCDLGKATARFVTGSLRPDGGLAVESAEAVAHGGHPMEAFVGWYRARDVAGCAALGATGVHAEELSAPVAAGLPEEACLQTALQLELPGSGALNLISIGARGYSVLTRDAAGRIRHLENDKCSSGTGETMVRIAGRFGLSIQEADRLARTGPEAIPITARCSVFAKSEMTHYGNQGRPAAALFRGYFGSVARYVAALAARIRVPGPVYVAGGCARIAALVEALGAALETEVRPLARGLLLEALGATLLGRTVAPTGRLPSDPSALVRVRQSRFVTLPPARNAAPRVTRLPAPAVPEGADRGPTLLGLDLGSTGSKAVLTSVQSGERVASVYDRTQGDPVGAARRLVKAMLARVPADVRAIGVTGSGREAVATVLRAALPDLGDRLVVLTEIVAHAIAAIRCDPDGGRSLSVVEIGGQDAKFVQIAGGQVVESDMNKACSAGTGSFLEEQARFYGIDDIEAFTDLAATGDRPPDLGQMCTVFVAEAAAEAAHHGYRVQDLFAGFQYSVVHNYIHRVMGQRTFADRIFFQGKPATGPSLAWTLAAVTGREVMVPPDPGAMGAWGIGLCAREALGAEALLDAAPLDVASALAAEVVDRREFQCRDKRCDTLCTIERTTVRVNGTHATLLSGGACSLVGVLPWLVTFLREAGFGVRVLRSGASSLARGEACCYAYDACAPVKVAHGTLDLCDVDQVFFPKILAVPSGSGPGGTTCPMEQGLPDIVREALRARGHRTAFLNPPLDLRAPAVAGRILERLRQVAAVADSLGIPTALAADAARRADRAQQQVDLALARIGRDALRWARHHRVPVVAVTGALHVIHDEGINASIPRLLTEHGVMAVPMDCYPADAAPALPAIQWGDANHALRVATACRAEGAAYPLLLTSFGCGPSSFVEQVFTHLMAGYPHTVLETDGHGGTAGYVTRVQAFLHTVHQHAGERDPVPADRVARLAGEAERSDPVPLQDARLRVLPMGQEFSEVLAAVYRSYGLDAASAGQTSPAGLAEGRRSCSGKECLPYQLVWGAFSLQLGAESMARPTQLLQVTGQGACRNCMFSTKDRITLARMGREDRVAPRPMGTEESLGWTFMARVWTATVCWDILFQLAAYYRPIEPEPGAADRLHARLVRELVARLDHPAHSGVAGSRATLRLHTALSDLAQTASQQFAALAARGRPLAEPRTVLVAGDIFLRVDEFASDGLIRRLNGLGLHVVAEPIGPLTEYLIEARSPEIIGLPTGRIDNAIRKPFMRRLRREVTARVRALHPWLPENDSPAMLAAGRRLIDRYPDGEAPATVGSVLHHWERRVFDGAVLVGPWGCGPALITESLLKHEEDMPTLFVYGDGSPIDERRLRAFAFRLRRTPPRAHVRLPGPPSAGGSTGEPGDGTGPERPRG